MTMAFSQQNYYYYAHKLCRLYGDIKNPDVVNVLLCQLKDQQEHSKSADLHQGT